MSDQELRTSQDEEGQPAEIDLTFCIDGKHEGRVVVPNDWQSLKAGFRKAEEEADQKRLAELRELVREEVEKALHPGVIDPGTFLKVEMRDQDGARYRGRVYRVQPTDIPRPAIPHDGNLDDQPQSGHHASVSIEEDYGSCDGSKLIEIYGGRGDCEHSQVLLGPAQALSLRDWLNQEEQTLRALVGLIPKDEKHA